MDLKWNSLTGSLSKNLLNSWTAWLFCKTNNREYSTVITSQLNIYRLLLGEARWIKGKKMRRIKCWPTNDAACLSLPNNNTSRTQANPPPFLELLIRKDRSPSVTPPKWQTLKSLSSVPQFLLLWPQLTNCPAYVRNLSTNLRLIKETRTRLRVKWATTYRKERLLVWIRLGDLMKKPVTLSSTIWLKWQVRAMLFKQLISVKCSSRSGLTMKISTGSCLRSRLRGSWTGLMNCAPIDIRDFSV